MFSINDYLPEHKYSLASIGLKKNVSKIFGSRQAANSYMYNICAKYHLHIKDIWDDKHDKTYVCENGVKFFIQRSM